MKPCTFIFGIFIAFIPKATVCVVDCMGKVNGRTCGRGARQITLPSADQVGYCGDPSGCTAKRTKYYYKCGQCQSITVKNKKMRGGQLEECCHENRRLYSQGTVGNQENAPESVPPSQGTSEASSYAGATTSTTHNGITFYNFFGPK
jgi:hypothetical protein